jgi:UDP-N-acetylglucosamine:LPS N-acetylglucosamine transferase
MTDHGSGKLKRVVIVPLNWGLGHATRLIPIISELKKSGAEILMGGSPSHLSLLKKEFPDLWEIRIPYSKIELTGGNSQLMAITCQLPKLFLGIIREHFALKNIIRKWKPDAVISDNCYGLWNRKVRSIFITHQVNIKIPRRIRFMEKSLNRLNHWFIKQFDECWVPDLPGDRGFSGVLSDNYDEKLLVHYIGILSRFRDHKPAESTAINSSRKKILVILSGPENQRTQFEKIILRQLPFIPEEFSCTVIRGLPSETELPVKGCFNYRDTGEMYSLMKEADCIICRSGYSTIMDLVMTGKSAILVPTPGQTEQEYLADSLSKKGYFQMMKQNNFSLLKAVESKLPAADMDDYRKTSAELLKGKLDQFINDL